MDEEVSRVLNGAVVGLVVCDHGTIDQKRNSGPGVSYTRGGDPPSPGPQTADPDKYQIRSMKTKRVLTHRELKIASAMTRSQ
jgi:hypothetical protein